MRPSAIFFFLSLGAGLAHAQETRLKTAGPGPSGSPQATFLAHRLGTDHAEGITTLDMNQDGFVDLLSGAYWYENPGAQGGDWKQHQYRTVDIRDELSRIAASGRSMSITMALRTSSRRAG
jgi:hypothetical protein